jgi:hypothetical protein
MNASWNQKYNLYMWAKEKGLTKVYAELEARNIVSKKMTVDRYKLIRNSILYNNPQRAIKLLNMYPIDYNSIDVSPRGGEL